VALSDYAVTIAVLVTTGVSFMGPSGVHVERISLPDAVAPTCMPDGGSGDTCCDRDSDSCEGDPTRAWGASFGADSGTLAKLFAAAAASAVPITFFFYIDQNISSRMCQLPECGLSRGARTHANPRPAAAPDTISDRPALPTRVALPAPSAPRQG
jgi:hypothetical protein